VAHELKAIGPNTVRDLNLLAHSVPCELGERRIAERRNLRARTLNSVSPVSRERFHQMTPAAWAEAQSRFARAWFSRATSSLNMMGMLMLTAQAAAMAPIRQTVAANAERLGG
jgi:hypothetical protein